MTALAATLLVLATALAACGDDDTTTAPAGVEGMDVTFIAGISGDPFYITLSCGAQAEAELNGMSYNYQAPSDWSAALQTPIVDAVTADGPDAVLIAPTDSIAMFAPIKQLADSGAKVVMVDTTLDDTSVSVAQVSTDDFAGGQEAAEIMADLIGGSGKVFVVNLQAGVSTTDARGAGFEERATELGLEYIGQEYAGMSPENAASIVSATLAAHPDLAGIFTTTDFSAEGAVTALRAAGKLGEIKIVGFDASPLMVADLMDGSVQAIVAQQARTIGQLGVQQAIKALNGEPTDGQIKLPTVTVTLETIDDPASQAVLQVDACG